MEQINRKVQFAMRDPMGDISYYESEFFIIYSSFYGEDRKTLAGEALTWDTERRANFAWAVVDSAQGRLKFLYSRGDSLDELIECVRADILLIEELAVFIRQRQAECTGRPIASFDSGYLRAHDRKYGFSYCAIALLLLPTAELKSVQNFIPKAAQNRLYALDILLKAFFPEWPLIEKYSRKDQPKQSLSWADPLVRALSVAPDKRTDAIAHYMKSWNRLMKPWGWKPKRVYCPLNAEGMQIDRDCSGDFLFVDFAFEAALAVCAYDLDDSSFRDHPYYPRDLVDYYRANIRHTRDAWRAQGVGADIDIEPPPLPKKLDLTRSKSKGLARWVELVSDGDKDATDAVVEQVGKLRKVKDVSELSCALAENGAGLHADLKDDDTLTSQIDTLTEKRQLEFEAPVAVAGGYAAGVGRCAGVLLALDRWLQGRPYRLLALDTQDDSWQAVLVARAHWDEFEQLSTALGIALLAPQDAFDV